MRIGVLTTSYPRHRRDLAGAFVAQLARWLAGRGHTLQVLAPAAAGGVCHESEQNIQVISVDYAKNPRIFYRAGAPDNLASGGPRVWAQAPAFALCLARQCHRRSAHWDRVLSHWLVPSSLVGARCARGLPHLAVAHSSDVHLMARHPVMGSVALALLAQHRTQLVLSSASLRPRLWRLCRGERSRALVAGAEVVRMGIPDRLLRPDRAAGRTLRRRHGLLDRTVVLCIGRLVPVKGVDTLLRACAGLTGVTVVVVGDGPQRDDLERLARGLPGCDARFIGRRTGPDRDAWLTAADLLVHPSRRLADGRTESAPVTLLEAMASGVPLLATDVGGNAELIRSRQNGLLVPPDRPRIMGEAIEKIIKNQGLSDTMIANGRQTASAHTWSRVGPRFEALLG